MPRNFRGIHAASNDCSTSQLPDQGPNFVENSRGKPQSEVQGDSLSDSLGDSRLAKLIEVWPALSDKVKAEILTLAGLRPDDVDDFNDVAPAAARGDVASR